MRIFESQEAAVDGILGNHIKSGRYRRHPLPRPARRPRHGGNALPDQLPKSEGLEKQFALIIDGRFSGGSSGLSFGHVLRGGGRRKAERSFR
jgi:dihydroxy-acid dehydratase